MRRPSQPAFTLVELLIVLAIIAMLASILLPALGRAKEMARRATCVTNVSSFYKAILAYATDHDRVLPDGVADNGARDVHWLAEYVVDELGKYVGTFEITDCPNWHTAKFSDVPGGKMTIAQGVTVAGVGGTTGFVYTGGLDWDWQAYPNAVDEWTSPRRLAQKSDLALLADRTQQAPPPLVSRYPHTVRGYRDQADGPTPDRLRVRGGNVGYLDGSARWVTLSNSGMHAASSSTPGTYFYW